MNLDCSTTQSGEKIIKLRGEMDAGGCTHIRPEIENLINTKNCSNMVLDLGQVSFLDSSGVGLIVFLYKRLKTQGCSLEVHSVQGQPQELIELLRIDKVIPVTIDVRKNSSTEKSYA